jgi:hypothetical protein
MSILSSTRTGKVSTEITHENLIDRNYELRFDDYTGRIYTKDSDFLSTVCYSVDDNIFYIVMKIPENNIFNGKTVKVEVKSFKHLEDIIDYKKKFDRIVYSYFSTGNGLSDYIKYYNELYNQARLIINY